MPYQHLAGSSSVTLDPELDQAKSVGPSSPNIRCPLCGWFPNEEDLDGNAFDAGAGRRTRIGTRNETLSKKLLMTQMCGKKALRSSEKFWKLIARIA